MEFGGSLVGHKGLGVHLSQLIMLVVVYRAKTGRPSISDRHRMAGEDPTISNNPEYH